MPTYEYECTKCKHAFERFQSMRDEPLKKCPQCAGKVKRLVGRGAGLIFKGGGFYQTDYRSASYQSGAKADTPSTPAPATPSSATPSTSPSNTTATPSPKKTEKTDGAKKNAGTTSAG